MQTDWQPLIGSSFVSFLLSFMLMKAWLPFAPKRPGELLLEVRLTWMQRLMVHRTQGIILLLYIVLGSLPGTEDQWFLPGTQPAGVAALAAILMLPLRYVFTTNGVAINNGTTWGWKSFRRYDIRQGKAPLGRTEFGATSTINLVGRPLAKGTAPGRTLYVPGTSTTDVARILRRCVR